MPAKGTIRVPKVECVCEHCTTRFWRYPSQIKQSGYGRFCSSSCRASAVGASNTKVRLARICRGCGATFHHPEKRVARGEGVYCSQSCRDAFSADFKSRLLAQRSVDTATGCWNWTGFRNDFGYGLTHANGERVRVHRLSAMVFKGFDNDPSVFVLHRCDNPACFNPEHLFFGTARDNADDRTRKGRMPIGSQRSQAKLNEAMVREIRQRAATGESFTSIARSLGISSSCIADAIHRKTWKHVA